MNEPASGATPLDGRSAGLLLREARLARGLDVPALAAQLRVAPARLEALEADRLDDLSGAAYSRSLAIAVCRALRIDPEPVLARLPEPDGSSLRDVGAGLNAPFKGGSAGGLPGAGWASRPVVVAPAIVLLVAALVWWWPRGPVMPVTTTVASAPEANMPVLPGTPPSGGMAPPASASPMTGDAGTTPATSGSPATSSNPMVPSVETVHSVPAQSAPAMAAAGRPLQLRADAESWVEVLDARGAVLMSRILQPGEQVGLVGAMPMQIKIGNASATTVVLRGQPLELASHTRDNVARLEVR